MAKAPWPSNERLPKRVGSPERKRDKTRFEDGILMHTVIVKYGREPSIQSQVLERTFVTG